MGHYFWMGQSLILPSLDREEKLIFVPMLGMRRMEKKRLRTITRRHSNIFYTSEQTRKGVLRRKLRKKFWTPKFSVLAVHCIKIKQSSLVFYQNSMTSTFLQ